MVLTGTRLPGRINLISDDLTKGLDTEVREGEGFGAVNIVDPHHAVFGLELIRQVPQQVFVAAQDLSDSPDREDVGDGRHGSRGIRLPGFSIPTAAVQEARFAACLRCARAISQPEVGRCR